MNDSEFITEYRIKDGKSGGRNLVTNKPIKYFNDGIELTIREWKSKLLKDHGQN